MDGCRIEHTRSGPPARICRIALACLCLFLTAIFAAPVRAQFEAPQPTVRGIEIRGNQRVDASTILYYIKTRVGEPLSRVLVGRDIEQIYSLGQFSDIRVDTQPLADGVKVIYIVEEIPSIGDVKFRGNSNLKTEDLRDLIALKRGATFRDHLIQDSITKLTEHYKEKAYFLAKIDIKHKLSPNGLVDVIIQIQEGEKVKIEEIRFHGNKAFDGDELEDHMETKSETWLSWFDESGIYKKDVLRIDVLRLESFYHDNGFLKVHIEDPTIEINREDKEIYVDIRIEEGDQYRLGSVTVQGDETYTREELLKVVESKKGEIYNATKMREDALRVSELYSEKGHAYADALPQTTLDDENKTVDVEVTVNPGRKVYVGKVDIYGNTRTQDNVIRREFRLKEGELFNSKKLKRSKQRINNLGFFENVKIDTHRGDSPELVDLTTTVTERPTGAVTFGAGFSSVEKVVFNASISQNNLFGTGRSLNLSTDLSARRTNFNFNFTDPRIFDSDISFGIDLFNRRSNFFSFDSRSTGAGLRLGKNLSETDWLGIGYRFEKVNISDVDPANQTAFLQNGTRTTSRIGPTFIRDTRDDFLNPTQGTRHVVRFEFAGSFLGGADFYKTSYEGTYYTPLIGQLVLALHGEVQFAEGYGNDGLPIFEHYFMGGSNSLRGFTIRQVGPKDRNGDPLGGDQALLINVELQYPITREFRLFAFYDRGNVYGTGFDTSTTSRHIDPFDMRQSVGGGVRFLSPFGPISLAYGVKLDAVPGDSNAEFHFSAGNAF